MRLGESLLQTTMIGARANIFNNSLIGAGTYAVDPSFASFDAGGRPSGCADLAMGAVRGSR